MRALAAALALCATAALAFAATAFATPSHGWQERFNFTTWRHDEYASGRAYDSLRQLAGTGAVAVALIPTWYQRSADATPIEPARSRSPSDESLAVAAVPSADHLHRARLPERHSRPRHPGGPHHRRGLLGGGAAARVPRTSATPLVRRPLHLGVERRAARRRLRRYGSHATGEAGRGGDPGLVQRGTLR